ncbi:ankyrin repeat protein [Necator americanus]|uniref:Ankyrin repeat protein n=1 Tax=Necator americanus TaxID=51031 RepID=W2T5N4_NECAM|nr:ankyrin repeat protein [Necator americanus]ETN76257.1 ankyrin repeat protein [Necator americanus]
MALSSHYHEHKPNVPIIMEDVFGWVREGNAFQVRVWLDDHEHDLNVGDDHAFSLLHWASKEGHVSIAEMLLSRGARVNATNMGDDTSLHLAAAHGHRPIAVKLLARKADVHATNEHGMTPLHYACYWGYEQIAEDLIISGAQIGACNKRGQTPMDVCQGPSRQAIAEIAIENGQNPNERIPFKDQTWKGTKSRTRDATLSRYTGVDVSSLNLITKIAESHSGELWRGKWQGNDIVARILALHEVTPRISRDFQTEFPALRIFAHTNICPVLAAANQPPNLVVISQYMPFGSLYNVLHEQSSVVIDHSQAIRFAVDIARGMSYLHSLDPAILRFYLSSKHVVVDEELTAKLSMADTKFSFQEVGRLYSPAWMSPEALQRDPEDLNIRAADMWSFGIMLWELNTREVPFSDLPPMECGMKIALEGLRVQIPPGIARNMSRLMNICLNEDPGRRPNFDQIIPILEKMSQ